MKCDYCGEVAAFVTGAVIYPHRPDLRQRVFYHCVPCDAYVGCHSGTTRPLGRLANAELRRAKSQAHAAFDPLWKARGWSRRQAYRWLAEQLGIPAHQCHVGMFDVSLCRSCIRRCLAALQDGER